jgi:hypothetical protein
MYLDLPPGGAGVGELDEFVIFVPRLDYALLFNPRGAVIGPYP